MITAPMSVTMLPVTTVSFARSQPDAVAERNVLPLRTSSLMRS